MRLDIVVGNPPYQEIISKNTGNKSLGKQLFPSFIKLSTLLTKTYVSLITPSKWFTSEGQDGSFISLRDWAKNNNHFKEIININNGKDIFSSAELASVNYFLYDKEYSGLTSFKEAYSENEQPVLRPLFESGLDIILSMNEMVSIINKVKHNNFESLTNITKGRDAFGVVGKKEIITRDTQPKYFNNSIEVRCAKEEIRYISLDKITKNIDLVNKWKVFTSKGNGGAGILTKGKSVAIIGKCYIGKPESICTDSLIPIGDFDNSDEAYNLIKYMQSKFLRFLVGILKVSQNIYQNVYQFVPLQDFKNHTKEELVADINLIDWSKSITKLDKEANEKYECSTINEIDAMLYKKYGLEKEEVQFIEKMIKSMK